jgi:MFS family permease
MGKNAVQVIREPLTFSYPGSKISTTIHRQEVRMFASISRGWGFLKQSVTMASADHDLIKPSLMLVVVSILISMIAIIPIVGVAMTLTGDARDYTLYILGALMIFVQYVVSYFFGGLTIALVYGYITQGDGKMNEAMDAVKRNFGGILVLAVVSTVVRLIENAARNRKSVLGAIFASILEAVWTTATYFILPAIIIENLAFGPAIKRSAYMIKNNLLLVAVGYVGVGLVLGLISFVVVVAGIAIGVAVGVAFAAIGTDVMTIVGIALGVLIIGIMVALVSAANSYIQTAYYTCLFVWAREVERVGQQAKAPAPLAAVMTP